MASRVLWLLDNETDDRTFERLCTSLMYRWGYRRIIPIGRTADRGRDAEAEVSLGEGRNAERVFFQFTLERRWEPKLVKELDKVRRNGHSIGKFVFVTRMSVTGAKRDKYLSSVRNDFGWNLELFDREWLRHQLEEVHPSLVSLYLDQSVCSPDGIASRLEVLAPPETVEAQAIWRTFAQGEYESAIPGLRRLLADATSTSPKDQVWAGLAWCYYCLFNYKDALNCIECALTINSDSSRHKSIRGCILCEQGNDTGARPLLVAAKTIFQDLVVDATDYGAYYNLGNALSGLGEYSEARDAFCEALKFNDKVAEVWKNLGTCHFYLGEHDRELECYDTALRLNPRLSHALASKANTTAVVFHDLEEALRLLEQALAADSEIGRRWPHFHWWKAHHLFKLGRLQEALRTVDDGLTHHPERTKLLDLKAEVLSALWRKDETARSAAFGFFQFRLEADPSEIPSLIELANLCDDDDSLGDAFEYLARTFNAATRSDRYVPSDLSSLADRRRLVSFANHLPGYSAYRRVRPLQAFQDENVKDDRYGFRYLWILFGLAYVEVVQGAPSKASSVEEIVAFYADVHSALKRAIQAVAVQLAKEFQSSDIPSKTEIMSLSLVKLAEAAFYESTWLFGYLPAANGVDHDAFVEANEQFIQQNDLSPFREDVLEAVLQPLNAAWHLFPDDVDPANCDAG